MEKPLRILIGNNTLALTAGSETWSMTLALALKQLGHQVECYSPELGFIADKLREADIRCYDRIYSSGIMPFSFVLEEKHLFEYDVIIANHYEIVNFLRKEFPKTPIISTIHGIIHTLSDRSTGQSIWAPEHPAVDAGVQQFVAVSEEVKDLLKSEYNLDSIIVRNFIDTKHFKPGKFNAKPKQILFNSNYHRSTDPEVLVIKEVAKHYGAKLMAIGENFSTSQDLMDQIKHTDIVIGMGRSVLEGLSAGKMGIVIGRWGMAGVIHPGNLEEIRQFNFSGRNASEVTMTAQELIAQINSLYTKDFSVWCRNQVLKDHNAKTAAEFFLQIARDLLSAPKAELTDPQRRPYRRAINA
jgi:glycosyltransferase involved in cell wall biosynthesis